MVSNNNLSKHEINRNEKSLFFMYVISFYSIYIEIMIIVICTENSYSFNFSLNVTHVLVNYKNLKL
jgi:hypothetical protein